MPHYGFSLQFSPGFLQHRTFSPMYILAVTLSLDFEIELSWPQWDGLEAVTQG